jgi:hypothetical protein
MKVDLSFLNNVAFIPNKVLGRNFTKSESLPYILCNSTSVVLKIVPNPVNFFQAYVNNFQCNTTIISFMETFVEQSNLEGISVLATEKYVCWH